MQLNVKITVYSLTYDWRTELWMSHRHRITNRTRMASRMINTNVVRLKTDFICRFTWNKFRARLKEKTTNARVRTAIHMKTAASRIRRASIILISPRAYFRFNLNYQRNQLIPEHVEWNQNQTCNAKIEN